MKGSTRKKVAAARKKTKASKKPKPRVRVIEVDLVDLEVADGGDPDGLHELAMEEYLKGRIELDELNELLALHSRKAKASLPPTDDEDFDAHLEELVNA